jgi:hypothetical protein
LISLEGIFRTDSIVAAFEQALDEKAERIGIRGLSEEEIVILAIEALEREVNNGGYDQLFVNSSKVYAAVIVHALRRIGCTRAAELTKLAIDALGIGGAITVEAIDQEIYEENAERDAKLTECDAEYYDVVGDLSGPLFEFIKRNRDKVVLTG